MYRIGKVIPALIERVGFREPVDPAYAGILSPENKESQSGRFFDDAHALVDVRRLKEVIIDEVNASNPNFNAYVKSLKEGVITKVLDAVFGVPTQIEQRLEYDYCDHAPLPVLNTGKFVGRQIKVAADTGKCVRVNSVNLHFTGVTTFNLYLFSSLRRDPIRTLEVTTEADSVVVVDLEEWDLSYSDIKNSIFYLGYFQDELGDVMAFDDQPHRFTCGKNYGSQPVEAVLNGAGDFVRYQPAMSSRTYGMNLEISSFGDFSEKIVRDPSSFDSAIALQMAVEVVDGIVHTLRSNNTQRISAEQAQKLWLELNADSATDGVPVSTGLRKQLRQELTALRQTFFPKQKPVSCSILRQTR